MKTIVVFTSCKVRLRSQVPRLNSPVRFPFGGETHKTNFPLFIDNFSRNQCCFSIDFRRNHLDDLFLEWRSPLLPNDIRLEPATHFDGNHKVKVKTQILFCCIHQTPNQNEAMWTHPLLNLLKANLLQHRFAQK